MRTCSSPHVWGTRSSLQDIKVKHRFIPTCVGNTLIHQFYILLHAVHPHMCGEHLLVPVQQHLKPGSSPHVWGTRLEYKGNLLGERFIPTCVGNTSINSSSIVGGAVHPHMCGEHFCRTSHSHATYGSSPHVWGTPLSNKTLPCFSRFIPTCVGNTISGKITSIFIAVHPHMCGEHVGNRYGMFQSNRFIPTCVGNTPEIAKFIGTTVGSSPHVWGTHHQSDGVVQHYRFIPTCVGNTVLTSLGNLPVAVHPHMCGEHGLRKAISIIPNGSSPHVWGTPDINGYRCTLLRFIPTCVGNTKAR